MSNFHFDLPLKLSKGKVHDFSGEVQNSQGRCKTISGEVQNYLNEGAHLPTPPLKFEPQAMHLLPYLPLQDNLACLIYLNGLSNLLMYGSILPFTIRPGNLNPQGFADFLFPKCQFPTPGQIKNGNFPPQGKHSQTIIGHKHVINQNFTKLMPTFKFTCRTHFSYHWQCTL